MNMINKVFYPMIKYFKQCLCYWINLYSFGRHIDEEKINVYRYAKEFNGRQILWFYNKYTCKKCGNERFEHNT